MQRTAVALVGACHPVPCVAVTAFATVLGLKAGAGAGTCVLLAVAVLAGQLSIGWSNDRLDVALDRAAVRTDKPLATGSLPLATVDRALAAALAVTIGASLALGWRAGLVHLGAVVCGWLYNLRLKATVLSWLPYALAFAALPAIATLALPVPTGTAWWALAAAALLGVAAHLTNALPDLRSDRAFGLRGLPHRLGARPSLLLAVAGSLAGSVVLVLGPAGSPSALRWAGLAVAATSGLAGGGFALRRPDTRWPFLGTIAVVALDLVLLLLGPSFVS